MTAELERGIRAPRRTWAAVALLLACRPLLAAAQGPRAEEPPAAWELAGTVEGTVRVKVPPPRRTAAGYTGRPAQAARPVQPVPAVVFLKGGGAGPASAKSAVMAQRDTAFVPALVVVSVGGAVSFPNQDPFFHNVFSYSGAERFDLGRYPRGESKSVTFDEAGVVKIYCEVHEFMRSAVIVSESGIHALVGADGRFSLTGVPAGDWVLVAWHPDAGQSETPIRVEEGGTTRVDLSVG